ncbi:hypothetical protein ACRALDRAFT_1076696 [Sodiomyces alcalophilus JCM 7366]|uniref:uncharacterized protein n=1 Tax=Sodiomyces alcalophilus JCM 7366 TaxID=591952 RepID=UPI0039B59D2D
MADTCGGSTPLKNFSQYGSQDRSLQQDRVVHGFHGSAAAGPSTFRSNARAASGQANANYQAFTAGSALNGPSLPAPSLFAGHGPEAHSDHSAQRGIRLSGLEAREGTEHPQAHLSPASSRIEVASWAHEFQRLAPNIAATGPAIAPSQAPAIGGPSALGQYGPNPFVPAAYHYPAPPPMMPQQTWASYNPVVSNNASASEVRGVPAPEDDFDDAMNLWMGLHGPKDQEARENINTVAESIVEQLETGEQAGLPETQSSLGPDATASDMTNTRTLPDVSTLNLEDTAQVNSGPILAGNDTLDALSSSSLPSTAVAQGDIQTTSTADTETKNPAQSDIAEAARQLLEAIAHEKGDKWKNSRFVSLMQGFSDGSKDIIDNEVREVGDFSVNKPPQADDMVMSSRQEKGKQPDVAS